ncbi:aspartate 1-decarboxylase [Planctomycetota bacterium]|nr:aspartate 1-decarboxylase [Planctomycetota bacterium]
MRITLLQAKLHRGAITACRLDYEGSLTCDPDLYEAVGMRPYQQIHVLNCNNGERFVTYLIEGRRGSREMQVNGPAARLAQVGDRIIVLTYADFEVAEVSAHHPVVRVLNERNQFT